MSPSFDILMSPSYPFLSFVFASFILLTMVFLLTARTLLLAFLFYSHCSLCSILFPENLLNSYFMTRIL